MTTVTPLNENKNFVIAIVGMAGSGKSEAATFFKEKGVSILRFGDAIDEEIKAQGLPWTVENDKYTRKKLRDELGMSAVAIKMLPKINATVEQGKHIGLDGLYSWEEYLYLKEFFSQLFLLCIYASPLTRYARLGKRKERSFTRKQARQRDIHEIEKINKAGPIAIADYLIKNETTIDNFRKELDKFWRYLLND